MQNLKRIGVSILMDDFGTHSTSLNNLRNLGVDEIKIDRKFIQNMTTNVNDANLVSAITGMSKGLQLHSTVAEGVETQEQQRMLKQLGCYSCQGYLYSQAVSAEAFEVLLHDGISLPKDVCESECHYNTRSC